MTDQDAAFEPCDCPEAEFLRELLAVANVDGPTQVPDTAFWRAVEHMADVIAVRKLRSLSHALSSAGGWTQHRAVRDDYPDPARTAAEIHRASLESWKL